jgi:hypothetical protein
LPPVATTGLHKGSILLAEQRDSTSATKEATVKTHVARILRNLVLRDRIRAGVLGYETGVVEPGLH